MRRSAQKKPYRGLGEMYGERAIQAPFMFITGKADQNGIARTMLGGVVLADMCTTMHWERWRGTAILIPSRIEFPVKPMGHSIEQMMTEFLNQPSDKDANRDDDKEHLIWREVWRV